MSSHDLFSASGLSYQLTCIVHDELGDVARVNGQLAVSRAFGDKNLKSHLRSDPDLLILASDGLWDVVSNEVHLGKKLICFAFA